MHFIEKFNGKILIDSILLRPPVLAILLETIERENFDGLATSLVSNLLIYSRSENCTIRYLVLSLGYYSVITRILQCKDLCYH